MKLSPVQFVLKSQQFGLNYCCVLLMFQVWKHVTIPGILNDLFGFTIRTSCSRLSSVSVFVLVDVGFEIPNHFVVGYALDYNEYFRDLNVSPESAVAAAQIP